MVRRRLRILLLSSLAVVVVVGIQDFAVQRLFFERALSAQVLVVQKQLGTVRASIEQTITSNLLRVQAMAAYISANQEFSQQDFERFAKNVMGDSALNNIAVAPDFVITRVYPIEGNEAILGIDYRAIPEQWPRARLARDERAIVVDGPIDLIQGGVGIIGRVPVFVETDEGEEFWGLTSSVISFERVLEPANFIAGAQGLEFALRRNAGGEEVVFVGEPDLFDDVRIEPIEVSIPSDTWLLVGYPVGGWTAAVPQALPVHVGSALVAILLILLIWTQLRNDERAAHAESAYRKRLELFFSQSIYGAFFSSIPEPISPGQEITQDLVRRLIAGERIMRSNAALDTLYRSRGEEVDGWTPADLFSVPQNEIERMWTELLTGGRLTAEVPHVCPDGSRMLIEGHYLPLRDDNGRTIGHFGVQRDVTEERKAEARLSRYVGIVDDNVITSQTDLEGRITGVSQSFCEISGYSREELLGASHSIINDPDADDSVFSTMWETIGRGEAWHGEFRNRAKDGQFYWVSADISGLRDMDGNTIGYMSVQQDITSKKLVEELSVTDRLTGIPNRLRLDEALEREHHRFLRYGTNYAVVLADIDHFKSVNDTLGHLAGDRVLQAVARCVQSTARETDLAGRWGGEEFLIVCPHTGQEGAAVLARKIREAVQDIDSGVGRRITASLGVAAADRFGSDEGGFEHVVAAADKALYLSKSNGRNRVSLPPDDS